MSKTCCFSDTRQKHCFAVLLSSKFSKKLFKIQPKLHKTLPLPIEFHTAISENLTNVNQTQYVIKDGPVTSQDSNSSLSTFCENGKAKSIPQLFDKGPKTNIIPLTDNNFKLEHIIPFQNQYVQKQFRKTESNASFSALLYDIDFHSEDDDKRDNRIPTRKELNYIQSKVEISTDYNRNRNCQKSHLKQNPALIHLN